MTRARALALVLACTVFASRASRAEESNGSTEATLDHVQRCVSEHDSARQLVLQERWFDARAAMSRCAAEQCPLAIASDCGAWLDELSRMLPTLLVFLERETNAPEPERIELDGQPFSPPEPPAPVELVPGKHRLRLSFRAGPALVRDFVLKKGEKNHVERVLLSAPPPAPPPRPRPRLTRPVPLSTYLFAGGAVAAFAGSTAWLASALRERSDARATCSPACDPSVHRSIETRLILSDVSGAAGLALGALALYTLIERPTVVGAGVRPALAFSRDRVDLFWQVAF